LDASQRNELQGAIDGALHDLRDAILKHFPEDEEPSEESEFG
jgi:hypothetical protein